MRDTKAIRRKGKILVTHADTFGLVMLKIAREIGAQFVRVTHYMPGVGGDPVHIADVYNDRGTYMPHGRYTQYYAVMPLDIVYIGEATFPAPEDVIAGCAKAVLDCENIHAAMAVMANVDPAIWHKIFHGVTDTPEWWEAVADAMKIYNNGITPDVARHYVEHTKVIPVWP